jgi:RNA polymerase sigma-70 factor (ECF subfamily)
MSATALERAFREEWASVVATLARRLGDLQLAEDAAQEAFASAAVVWPRDGPPPRPGAWLTVTAWRKALDMLRRQRRFAERAAEPEAAAAAWARAIERTENVSLRSRLTERLAGGSGPAPSSP